MWFCNSPLRQCLKATEVPQCKFSVNWLTDSHMLCLKVVFIIAPPNTNTFVSNLVAVKWQTCMESSWLTLWRERSGVFPCQHHLLSGRWGQTGGGCSKLLTGWNLRHSPRPPYLWLLQSYFTLLFLVPSKIYAGHLRRSFPLRHCGR